MTSIPTPRSLSEITQAWVEEVVLQGQSVHTLDSVDLTREVDLRVNLRVAKMEVTLTSCPNDRITWTCKTLADPVEPSNLLTKTNNMEKEAEFYNRLYPEIEKYLGAANLRTENLLSPPVFAAFDGRWGIVILKDLVAHGYEPGERGKYLNYSQAKVALETLARFHAVSHFHKKMLNNNYGSSYTCVHKPLTNDTRLQGLNEVLDMVKTVLQGVEGLRPIARLLSAVTSNITPYRECHHRLRQVVGPLSFVTHGDLKPENFLFLKNNGKFVECALRNWYYVSEMSPLVDLMTFMLLNLQAVVRKNHFSELLEFYFDHLQKYVKLLSGETIPYPHDQFLLHCRYYALPALYITVYYYADIYCHDLHNLRTTDTVVKQFVRSVTNKSKNFITPEFRDRVVGLFTHLQTLKMLPT